MGKLANEAGGWSDRFLSAALEPQLWDGVSADMAEATASSRGQLIGFGPGTASFNWVTGMDEDQIAHSAAIDMCADLDIMHGCQTKLVSGDGIMIGLALLRSEKDGRTDAAQRARQVW